MPGSNLTGLATYSGTTPARFLMSRASAGEISPMPEVCVSRWRIVTRAGLPSAVLSCANSGMCFSTGSSTDSLPSSWSINTAVAVIGLVIDAIQKMVSGRMGRSLAMSAFPVASRCTIRSGVATSVTAPAISRSWTNRLIRSRMPAMASGVPRSPACCSAPRPGAVESSASKAAPGSLEADNICMSVSFCRLEVISTRAGGAPSARSRAQGTAAGRKPPADRRPSVAWYAKLIGGRRVSIADYAR